MRYVKKGMFGRIKEYLIGGTSIDVNVHLPRELHVRRGEDVDIKRIHCTTENCKYYRPDNSCGLPVVSISGFGCSSGRDRV
jgi:hypothetical protein